MRISLALSALTATLFGAPWSAVAQSDDDLQAPPPPDLSPDFLDPEARTRFHLTTRWTPAPGTAIWTFELSGAIRVSENFALTVSAPFGLDYPHRGVLRASQGFFGNFSLGAAGGTSIRLDDTSKTGGGPKLSLGGAIDLYAPTSPSQASVLPLLDRPYVYVLAARPLHPGTWAIETTSARARFHAGFSISILDLDAELGLTPAVILESGGEFLMHFGGGLRARVTALPFLEPYLELAGSTVVVEPATFPAPGGAFFVTPGVRFHAGDFSPAIFVHIQAGDGSSPETFTLGIDLAAAAPDRRPSDPDEGDF